jgi:hypothetical protein
MYRELIHSLTFIYSLCARGKGSLPDGDLRELANGAHKMTECTPIVERGNGKKETANDLEYLKEASMIDQQIEELVVYLNTLEII